MLMLYVHKWALREMVNSTFLFAIFGILFNVLIDSISFSDSRYGKPNKTVHLSNVVCSGSENSLTRV